MKERQVVVPRLQLEFKIRPQKSDTIRDLRSEMEEAVCGAREILNSVKNDEVVGGNWKVI